jgi:hypothetical protein
MHTASKVTGEVDPKISTDVKLADLGFDSMRTLTFIKVVQHYTGYRIPLALMPH